MTSTATLAGLLMLLQSVAAPAPPATSPPATMPVDASTVPGDPASTAVKLRAVETRMTVPVLINGKGPFRFIVDSGATRTVVSSALAAQLGLPAGDVVPLHSVGGESEVPTVRIDSLYVGALPAKAIEAPVLDADNLGGAGILGIDTLQGKKVVIDLLRHRMSVEPADRRVAPPVDGEIVVRARSRLGQLVLADAEAARQKIWAVVDTGSMVTIGNLALRDRLVRHKRVEPIDVTITDVTGREITASMAPIGSLRLGGYYVSNLPIAFDDAHAFDRFGLADKPAMLLGMDLIAMFDRVTIDFVQRRVRLLKRRDGFSYTIRNDGGSLPTP